MRIIHLGISILIASLCLSCFTEDIDDSLTVAEADLIATDSELFTLLDQITADDELQEDITCIDFLYSFTVVVYSETAQVSSRQVVNSDAEFSELLGSINEGQFIGISFPISSQLEDGTTFVVNDKDELMAAIDLCVDQEETVSNGTAILLDCVWEVQLPEEVLFSTYTDAVFDVEEDGTLVFYHRGISYGGTWIFLFIEDEFHLNINIDNQEEIGADWNFNWRVPFVDEDTIAIEIESGLQFILEKECEELEFCRTLDFQSCELESNPGFAEFVLSDYIDCIIIIAASQQTIDETTGELSDPVDWQVTFYNTEEDAQLAENAVDAETPFTSDGAVFYVRIENPETLEFSLSLIHI